MNHIFYIDVPNDYKYVYRDGDRYGPDVLTREYGVPIRFICNSLAKISDGDVHAVIVNNVGEELFFLLKNDFKKVNTQVVQNYLQAKIDARTMHSGKVRYG